MMIQRRSFLQNLGWAGLGSSIASASSLIAPDANSIELEGVYNVTEFGAAGDGITDDTRALQEAIKTAGDANKQRENRGATVYAPPGTYLISDTLLIRNVWGLRFVGAGFATVLQWRGGPSQPMWLLQNVRDCDFKSFFVRSDPSYPLDTVFRTEKINLGTITPTNNLWSHIHINGTNRGGLNRGFHMATGDVDENNDLHMWQRVIVTNYDEEGWLIDQSQSHANFMLKCGTGAGAGDGKYGVNCQTGWFHWREGSFDGHSQADILIDGPGANYTVEGTTMENSKRLLVGEGPTGGFGRCLLQGIRWAGNKMAADQRMIIWRRGGPLILRNCGFGGGSTAAPKIFLDYFDGGRQAFECTGCNFGNDGSLTDSPFVFSVPDHRAEPKDVLIRANQFGSSGGKAGRPVFGNGITAPIVHREHLWYTANMTPTTIDNFEGGYPTQEIRVVFDDDNTTVNFANNSRLQGNGGRDWSPNKGDHMTCVFDGKSWYCNISAAAP